MTIDTFANACQNAFRDAHPRMLTGKVDLCNASIAELDRWTNPLVNGTTTRRIYGRFTLEQHATHPVTVDVSRCLAYPSGR